MKKYEKFFINVLFIYETWFFFNFSINDVQILFFHEIYFLLFDLFEAHYMVSVSRHRNLLKQYLFLAVWFLLLGFLCFFLLKVISYPKLGGFSFGTSLDFLGLVMRSSPIPGPLFMVQLDFSKSLILNIHLFIFIL